MEKIVIVGCGTAGIATAIELINNGYNGKDILMIDKGNMIDKRKCFVNENTPCKKCRVCSITHGCGGTGSFSDSKLNFDTTGKVGGDMAELMTEKEIGGYLRRTYEIYKQFGIEEFQSVAIKGQMARGNHNRTVARMLLHKRFVLQKCEHRGR